MAVHRVDGERRYAAVRDERAHGVESFLRQLWRGLSAYRLFPGSLDHPGFVAAAERIDAAARAALASGPIDVEIRGDRILHEGVELAADDHLRRLALACFERRVERLTVVAVPDARDLDLLYALLARDPDDLDAEGGAGEALRMVGVSSVVLSSLGSGLVQGASSAGDVEPRRGAAPLPESDRLATEALLEDLQGTPDEQAETLLSRLKAKLAGALLASGPAIDLQSEVHSLVADLPPDIRRALVRLLVDRVAADPFAERLISTMSNAELARSLVDLGSEGGRSPAEMARAIAEAGIRHVDIVDLTAALESGQEDAGTIIAGLEQLGIDTAGVGGGAAVSSVTDVISNYLGATEIEDVREIRASLSRSGDLLRAEAISALGDYLALESDLERTSEALDLWSEELRQAMRARDVQGTRWLAGALREALLGGERDRKELFQAYVRHALEPELVAELLAAEADEGGAIVSDLLEPFDDVGVEVVLELLAAEEDRTRRARLLGVAKRTVGDRVAPLVTRLSDPRWFVVRNALVLLGATGRADLLPDIEQLARHPSEAVRREVPAALAAAGGIDAVPTLGRLAQGGDSEVRLRSVAALGTLIGPGAADALVQIVSASDDRSLKLRALEELSRRPDGAQRLRALASGASGRRLPWGLRQRARSLARSEGRS